MNPNEQTMGNSNIQPTIPPTIPPINSSSYSPMNSNGHKKVGPIVAILIIVLVLIIAALYLFASRINQQTLPVNTPITDMSLPNDNEATVTQSVQSITNTSDDVQSLQDDLNTSTNGLDTQNF
jgi:hypothetical protein